MEENILVQTVFSVQSRTSFLLCGGLLRGAYQANIVCLSSLRIRKRFTYVVLEEKLGAEITV